MSMAGGRFLVLILVLNAFFLQYSKSQVFEAHPEDPQYEEKLKVHFEELWGAARHAGLSDKKLKELEAQKKDLEEQHATLRAKYKEDPQGWKELTKERHDILMAHHEMEHTIALEFQQSRKQGTLGKKGAPAAGGQGGGRGNKRAGAGARAERQARDPRRYTGGAARPATAAASSSSAHNGEL